MMLRQARSSRQVTGRRELHDLGSRSCSALPRRPTWQTVMNLMPSDYAEALKVRAAETVAVFTERVLQLQDENNSTIGGRRGRESLARGSGPIVEGEVAFDAKFVEGHLLRR